MDDTCRWALLSELFKLYTDLVNGDDIPPARGTSLPTSPAELLKLRWGNGFDERPSSAHLSTTADIVVSVPLDGDVIALARDIKAHLHTSIRRGEPREKVLALRSKEGFEQLMRQQAELPERGVMVSNVGVIGGFVAPIGFKTTDLRIRPFKQLATYAEYGVYTFAGKLTVRGKYRRDCLHEEGAKLLVRRIAELLRFTMLSASVEGYACRDRSNRRAIQWVDG